VRDGVRIHCEATKVKEVQWIRVIIQKLHSLNSSPLLFSGSRSPPIYRQVNKEAIPFRFQPRYANITLLLHRDCITKHNPFILPHTPAFANLSSCRMVALLCCYDLSGFLVLPAFIALGTPEPLALGAPSLKAPL